MHSVLIYHLITFPGRQQAIMFNGQTDKHEQYNLKRSGFSPKIQNLKASTYIYVYLENLKLIPTNSYIRSGQDDNLPFTEVIATIFSPFFDRKIRGKPGGKFTTLTSVNIYRDKHDFFGKYICISSYGDFFQSKCNVLGLPYFKVM